MTTGPWFADVKVLASGGSSTTALFHAIGEVALAGRQWRRINDSTSP